MDITFHRLDKKDLPDLLELKKESWFGTHTVTLSNSQNQEKWFEEVSRDTHCPRNLILVATIQNNPRGIFKVLNIDWQSRKAEVGWDIYAIHRHYGYGKVMVKAGVDYCFNVINLRRLEAQILVNNEASLKCARYAGFEQEGLQKQSIFKNGTYIDNLLFGLIKNDKCPNGLMKTENINGLMKTEDILRVLASMKPEDILKTVASMEE